jgi:hypothetical protein
VGFTACKKEAKLTNWQMQLRVKEKDPYDLYLTYTHLKDIFPKANISEQYKIFEQHQSYLYMPTGDSAELRIITADNLLFSPDELYALTNFVQDGNYVVIATDKLDQKFMTELGVNFMDINLQVSGQVLEYGAEAKPGLGDTFKTNLLLENLPNLPGKKEQFDYVGKAFTTTISSNGNQGYNEDDNFNALITSDKGAVIAKQAYYGKGKFLFVASPIIFTNHFITTNNNSKLVEYLFSLFPQDIAKVKWHSYIYRPAGNENGGIDNPLAKLLKYPMWKRAIILTILGLLLYALVLARRKQKPVEVIPPVKNDSLEFVETVGYLYFNKHDNRNIGLKMATYFLDYLKTKYNLPLLKYDNQFVPRVASKSGKPTDVVQALLDTVQAVNSNAFVSDELVMELYKLIQNFKHNT